MGGSVVFIFQRDFRIADNHGFREAAKTATKTGSPLVPVFLADDRQLDPLRNPYLSDRCVRLMAECLADLSRALRDSGWPAVLVADHERAAEIFASRRVSAREVHHNRDHTPFAIARDARLGEMLKSAGITVVVHSEPEYTLWTPGTIATQTGTAYKVYSPFVRACEKAVPPRLPGPGAPKGPGAPRGPGAPKGPGATKGASSTAVRAPAPSTTSPSQLAFARAYAEEAALEIRDGSRTPWRDAALAVLKGIAEGEFDGYEATRNAFASWPENGGTTGLSVPMKFGAVSCREVRRAFERVPGLLSELMWREFYAHVAAGFPEVLAGQLDPPNGHELNRHELGSRDRVLDSWRHGPAEEALLEAWERGDTGEPLVDSAMRQLGATGRLHNRLRMVVASHLVKEMGVDWRRGERVFARLLIDYDPCSNGGGWRAMDSQAPGREILAPSQAKKHDPKGAHQERWAAEEKP